MKIREPIVEDIFYPADAGRLRKDIEELLSNCTTAPGNAGCIISPHAGYEYAGDVCAEAFCSVSRRNPGIVVIIAPVHREHTNYLFLPESSVFSTPLGNLEVDEAAADELSSCSTNIIRNDLPHLEEHSIEVQLPFIRHIFGEVKIIPLLVGEVSKTSVEMLRRALQTVFASRSSQSLFVLSSNFSGFGPPGKTAEEADILLADIKENNWKKLLTDYRERRSSACGSACIAGFLAFNHARSSASLLKKKNSSTIGGNKGKSIEYAAVSFLEDVTL